MRIWITISVTNKRIPYIDVDVEGGVENLRYFTASGYWIFADREGKDWHRTPEAAVSRMTEMRDAYIAKLRASIDKHASIVYTAEEPK